MTSKIIKKTIKATIMDVIVALLITASIFFLIFLFFGARINETVSLISKVSVNIENKKVEKVTINDKNQIKNYPEYGTQYAKIKIPAINVDLPVFFGETLDVLKKGVGHSSGSYFPGEGGSIIYMGHNSEKVFRRFSELKLGDEIEIDADYGTFKYKIYDMQLIEETEVDKVPTQKNEEILMVYTCYPFNNIGYAHQRYVVYAKPIE